MDPHRMSELSKVVLACAVFSVGLATTARGWGQGLLSKDLAKEVMKIDAHSDPVDKLVLSPDGKRLFSGSFHSRTVTAWDSETGTATMWLERERLGGVWDGVMSLALSADGQQLFLANREIEVWNLQSHKEIMTLRGHEKLVSGLALAKDRKRLFSGSVDGTIKAWDLETGKEILTITARQRPLTSIVLSADNKRLFSGRQRVSVWDLEAGKLAFVIDQKAGLESLASSDDGKRIFCGTSPGTIMVWTIE